jgi:transposase, IS30 family
MVAHLSVEQRQLALRLKARGLPLRQIGREVGCSHELVRILARGGPRRQQRAVDPWVPGPGWLMRADREEISPGLHHGEAFAVIACRLGKATSTVSREVAANGGRAPGVAGSSPGPGTRPAAQDLQAGLPPAGCAGHRLAGGLVVAAGREISRRLRIEFADNPMMRRGA